jgi:hypothetical protein
MPMAPSPMKNAFSRKRSHREALEPHGVKNYSPNSKTGEPPAKRTQKSTGTAKTYTTQVQRVSVKKKKTTYLVRLQLSSICKVVVIVAETIQDSFSVKPEAGFTYLPVGFREIKEKCRDECIRQNKLYYVVNVSDTILNPLEYYTDLILNRCFLEAMPKSSTKAPSLEIYTASDGTFQQTLRLPCAVTRIYSLWSKSMRSEIHCRHRAKYLQSLSPMPTSVISSKTFSQASQTTKPRVLRIMLFKG